MQIFVLNKLVYKQINEQSLQQIFKSQQWQEHTSVIPGHHFKIYDVKSEGKIN